MGELTAFALSTENINRPKNEVNKLLKLFEWYIRTEITEINSNNIMFKVVGNRDNFSEKFIEIINYSEKLTKNNTGLKLYVAVNYGGRLDFLTACKNLYKYLDKQGKNFNEITEKMIRDNLLSSEIKDLDMLIRTGGETRISNFLLWQLTYSEIFFSKTLWPDFKEEEFENLIKKFSLKDRRYGVSNSIVI